MVGGGEDVGVRVVEGAAHETANNAPEMMAATSVKRGARTRPDSCFPVALWRRLLVNRLFRKNGYHSTAPKTAVLGKLTRSGMT